MPTRPAARKGSLRRTALTAALVTYMVLCARSLLSQAQSPNGPTYAETKCVDDLVVAHMKQAKVLAGSVAFMKGGRVVYSQGYGVRDVPGIDLRTGGRKTMPQTPFRIASISKPITAITILRLMELGKV